MEGEELISESGYWEAKKQIAALEQSYAKKAVRSGTEHDQRKYWGYCDGMKKCLQVLEQYVEEKSE
ncbi:MAG: hypothetical protein ABSB80_11085 [Methanoregula sp.]|jgi:hypothetical protein|uniref:hypothetical protein n=1 Tax=Methanoregula sp. TaxID=2052170 RepID=UPI003D135D87